MANDHEDSEIGSLGEGAFGGVAYGGSLDQGADGDELLERFLQGAHDSAGSSAPLPGVKVEPAQPQPVNQATMCCLRGPCMYLWQILARFGTLDDEIRPSRLRTCMRHYDETPLADQNVYACDQWWPAPLQFVPESLRSTLREPLRQTWELVLQARGYDFSWRWFRTDQFETDRPEERGRSGLGVSPATFLHEEAPSTTGRGGALPDGA